MKQGWEIKKLDEVCDFENGDRGTNYPSKAHRTQTGIPFINAGHLSNNGIDFKEMDYISTERYELLGAGKIRKNDILFCLRGSLGKFASVENLEIGAIASSLVILRPKESILHRYLLCYLESNTCVEMINNYKGGAAQPNLSAGSLKNFKIPIPPLLEQERIVSILDKTFSAIEQAKQNAAKNLKNAKELFDSYLNSIFTNKGDNWEEKKLGELCNVIGGGTPSKTNSQFFNGDILWATVRDMKGEIISDTEHKITTEAVKNSSTNVIPKGNVVIATRVGLGKVCLIENDTAINQDLRGVVPINSKKLSVDFLYHWFKSIAYKIVKEGTGATVQGVKLPFIKSLPILLPSLEEQKTVVKKLDKLSAETKQLEKVYQQKIMELDDLKKSILQKAFNGELI